MSEPRIMRLPEVVERTGYKRASIYKLIRQGNFPAPVPLGARAVGWSSKSVQDWINARIGQADQRKPAKAGRAKA